MPLVPLVPLLLAFNSPFCSHQFQNATSTFSYPSTILLVYHSQSILSIPSIKNKQKDPKHQERRQVKWVFPLDPDRSIGILTFHGLWQNFTPHNWLVGPIEKYELQIGSFLQGEMGKNSKYIYLSCHHITRIHVWYIYLHLLVFYGFHVYR